MMIAHVGTVARREIQQRWVVLAFAVALGVAPIVAAAVTPALRPQAGVLAVADFFIAQAFAALIGLGLVGDASGRLSWYFSRPLSGFAIWAGKVGGAALLAIAATLLMTLPVVLASHGGLSIATPLGAAGFGVLPLLFVAIGTAGGIIARGRTRWLILDAAGIVGIAPILSAITSLEHRGHDLDGAILLAFTVAFLAGSAAGIIIGRADARRAHAACSVTLWSSLFASLVALWIYARPGTRR